MEKVNRFLIGRLPWHLVWIIALMEGITVAILPYVSDLSSTDPVRKPLLSGFLLGYIGMAAVFLAVSFFGKKLFPDKPVSVKHPLFASFWGGFYLFLIFLFQRFFAFEHLGLFGTALRGFLAVAASTAAILFLYAKSAKILPFLSISFSWGKKIFRLLKISMLPAVIFLSLYEAAALPIIELLRNVDAHRWFYGFLLGFTAGGVGTSLIVFIYNTCPARKDLFTIFLEIRETGRKQTPE